MSKTGLFRFALLLLLGLIVFLFFAGFLISERIQSASAVSEKHLDNRAERIAYRLEDILRRTREHVELIALNPLVQKENPAAIAGLLTELNQRYPFYEAIMLIDNDGALIAGSPDNISLDFLEEKGNLERFTEKCELLYEESSNELPRLIFAAGANVPEDNNQSKVLVALVDLTHFIEKAAPLGNSAEKVLLTAGDGTRLALFSYGVDEGVDWVSTLIFSVYSIVVKDAPLELQGRAYISGPDWEITVSKPYKHFIMESWQETFANYYFYILLLFPLLTMFAAIIMWNVHTRRYFKELAIKDGLTGLSNYRFFQAYLRTEIAGRENRKFSLLMIDVDDFKRYNDEFGHPAGDKLLKKIADAILSSIRSSDVAARYGGEEFAVVLPGLNPKGAIKLAERIRKAVKRECEATISIGVSSLPQYATTVEELIEGADKALYRAKHLSKDRVEGVWALPTHRDGSGGHAHYD